MAINATTVEVVMPAMGDSVSEGTVLEWHKAEGDSVSADETLVEISTDKVDAEVPAPVAGTVVKVHAAEGDTIHVGGVLAEIAPENGVAPSAPDAVEREPEQEREPEPEPEPEAAAETVDIVMPAMGESVSEGVVLEWAKQVGDAVEADETIVDISTDKVDAEVPAPASGTVTEILANAGDTVTVGQVLARMSAGDGAKQTAPAPEPAAAPRPAGARRGEATSGDERSEAVEADAEPPMHIESPYKPDHATAPKKRRSRFAQADEPALAPAPTGAGAPLSRMRQSIGRAMVQSLQTAATCTTIVEADLSRVELARKQLGVTYLPIIARATIETLREFPTLNATLEGETFTTFAGVHLGVAVSLGDGGLIVPVIRDAQELSVEGLAARIKELAGRARENALTPDEVRGGSFTITNPGGYGSLIATPVINLPQVAILDTEAVVKRPVVITDELGNDSIAIRHMTYLCMSWDHRALDGALAAQFLRTLGDRLEAWPVS
jgi:pyruvate/2-oxoglutarate dehydrogenase complex dihydrolipoamide acyltransferase (E2) component